MTTKKTTSQTTSQTASQTTSRRRAPLSASMSIIGPDGARAQYITPAEAAERLGMLTPRVVQHACRAYWTRIEAERAAHERGERAAAPDYAANTRELRCVRLGVGTRGWFYVREDTLDSLEFKRPELKGRPGVWGRVAGTPSKRYRPRPSQPLASKSASKSASNSSSKSASKSTSSSSSKSAN